MNEEPANKDSEGRRQKWIVPVVIAGLVVAGVLVYRAGGGDEETGGDRGGGPGRGGAATAPVRTVIVEAEEMETRLFLNGSLLANESVEVRPETSGRVVEIAFVEGQVVEEGALLARIDERELKAMLAAAEQRQIFAESQFEREEQLFGSGGSTQAAFDAARNDLELARAEVELTTTRLDRMELRAPFAGKVGLRQVSPGALVDSSTVITTLQQIDVLKLDFPVPERHLPMLELGMPVDLRIAGLAESFRGEVAAIEPRIDPETRTVMLRALVENDDGLLLPGGFAAIELVLEREDEAIMVPAIALRPGLERDIVYVVDDGKAVVREVTIGTRTSDKVRILEGLEPGEEVIVDGVQSVRPGQEVRVFNRTDEEPEPFIEES